MHVCHHNSIGITTSMLSCVPLSISIVRRVWYFECFAFPNQCLKLQFYGGGNAIRGKNVCTIVNAVNLLTAYVTYIVHKYADCRRTQQITYHFRIVRLKHSSITLLHMQNICQLRVNTIRIRPEPIRFCLFAVFCTHFYMDLFCLLSLSLLSVFFFFFSLSFSQRY